MPPSTGGIYASMRGCAAVAAPAEVTMLAMPIVALATTTRATVISNDVSG